MTWKTSRVNHLCPHWKYHQFNLWCTETSIIRHPSYACPQSNDGGKRYDVLSCADKHWQASWPGITSQLLEDVFSLMIKRHMIRRWRRLLWLGGERCSRIGISTTRGDANNLIRFTKAVFVFVFVSLNICEKCSCIDIITTNLIRLMTNLIKADLKLLNSRFFLYFQTFVCFCDCICICNYEYLCFPDDHSGWAHAPNFHSASCLMISHLNEDENGKLVMKYYCKRTLKSKKTLIAFFHALI